MPTAPVPDLVATMTISSDEQQGVGISNKDDDSL